MKQTNLLLPSTSQAKAEPINYLMKVDQKAPLKSENFYEKQEEFKDQYSEVWGTETHLRRRLMILKSHPEISELLVPTKPISIILTFVLVTLNMIACYLVKDSSWTIYFLTIYIVGGTINHTLYMLAHDFVHSTGHSNPLVNRVMGMITNIPMGVPTAMTFHYYHNQHHNFLNDKEKDPDYFIHQAYTMDEKFVLPFKIFFFLGMSLFLAIKPMQKLPHTKTVYEWCNLTLIIIVDLLILHFMGLSGIFYVLLSTFFSLGPHPAAMNFYTEHYEFVKGMQTYDYFGVWNILNLNVGYHIEHHDFPSCPWYNLPALRKAAPEFYDHLPYHTSYMGIMKKFLFDGNFTHFNRTVRLNDKKSE